MPVDKNGQRLKQGDRVWIPCIVRVVKDEEKFENVVLETTEYHFPYEPDFKRGRNFRATSTIGLNGRQCQKEPPGGDPIVKAGDEVPDPPPSAAALPHSITFPEGEANVP